MMDEINREPFDLEAYRVRQLRCARWNSYWNAIEHGDVAAMKLAWAKGQGVEATCVLFNEKCYVPFK